MTKLTFTILMILMSISCNIHQKNTTQNNAYDTLQKERIIPYHEDSSVHHSRQQLFLRNFGNLMGLPSIFNGVNGVYIRIWLWDSKTKYVININSDYVNDESEVLAFNTKKIDSSEYVIIHKEWRNLKPKSGWQDFFAAIEKYKITTLQSGKSAKEQKDFLTHMAYIQFEVAQPGQYRFYEYLEPSFYRYVDKGSNNIYEFLKYYDKEMNVQLYNPAKDLFEKP